MIFARGIVGYSGLWGYNGLCGYVVMWVIMGYNMPNVEAETCQMWKRKRAKRGSK